MQQHCQECGAEAEGRYCSNCGAVLVSGASQAQQPTVTRVIVQRAPLSRSSRLLLNGVLAVALASALIFATVWVGQNWTCKASLGPNPLYGMPEDSQMIDVTGDGVIDDYDIRAIGFRSVQTAVHQPTLYVRDNGWTCARHVFD